VRAWRLVFPQLGKMSPSPLARARVEVLMFSISKWILRTPRACARGGSRVFRGIPLKRVG
jgi:hypothetical protein